MGSCESGTKKYGIADLDFRPRFGKLQLHSENSRPVHKRCPQNPELDCPQKKHHYKTPENAFANLAMLEIRRGRYESAQRYVQKGLIKNNKFSLLLNALGLILEHEDDLSEAIFNFEKAVSKVDPFVKTEIN